MATISNIKKPTGNTRSIVIQWSGMANGDVGQPLELSQYTDKSVQVSGAFGAGGVLRWEGSNDGVNWAVLTDPQGNNLDFVQAKIEMVTEPCAQMRPRVTGGDGTTNLDVTIFMKE